ncbi:hypothetical protein C3B79_3889 [Aeromonas hydrophila]|nr:hypothetical protein C3B79_3889 [Aeromonas hydrophila]
MNVHTAAFSSKGSAHSSKVTAIWQTQAVRYPPTLSQWP